MPLFDKIQTIAKEIYRADDVTADKSVKDQLKTWEEMGFGKLPVCMAKTQYSFSTNPEPRARRRASTSRCAKCGCRPARNSSSRSAARS